jgi:type III secretion system low calcium response chaperone LcrH/SycD
MKQEPESDELYEKLEEVIGDAASLLANLRKEPIIVPRMPKDAIQKDFIQGLQSIVQRLQHGMSKILEFLTSTAAHDPIALSEETTQQLCQIAAVASVMADNPQDYLVTLAKDKTLQDIFGLSNETMERLYQAAKYLYEQQNYFESAAAFSVLCCITPSNHTFWMGFGNSEYFCHNYSAALTAYSLASQVNPHDPLSHFYSSRCYEALKQKDHAIHSLELALLQIGNQPEFSQWKQRAIEHKQRISKMA